MKKYAGIIWMPFVTKWTLVCTYDSIYPDIPGVLLADINK